MVQGNLKLFQANYEAMKYVKALLSESLSSEQNAQNSTSDLRPNPAETAKSENISPSLLKSIPLLQEHFTKLEMEMVQLRETVLKQEQSDTCHTELKQNTEHLTQRLTALTQQMRKLQKKDSYQCELTALRLQLQDREQSTLEMRQQLREIQEEREIKSTEIQTLKEQLREIQEERETESNEIQTLKEQLRDIQETREMENSEIQALKEQLRELLLARKEPEQTHRAQTMPSTPELSNTRSQHPPLCAERHNPDSSQPSQRPLSGSPVPAQQHQPSSHSRPPTPHPKPRPEHLPELQHADRIHTDRDYPTTVPQLQQLKPAHSRPRPSQAD
ncbi:hypothetical protein ABG768_021699 [Culter alburnus]|uniref:Uncharacterized protein n=1 Tax=Culter alburnus TaxID=194366 RepID=A0AAW2ARX0_CULAL